MATVLQSYNNPVNATNCHSGWSVGVCVRVFVKLCKDFALWTCLLSINVPAGFSALAPTFPHRGFINRI